MFQGIRSWLAVAFVAAAAAFAWTPQSAEAGPVCVAADAAETPDMAFVNCFAVGADNALWRSTYREASGWSPWRAYGGIIQGELSCVNSAGASRTSYFGAAGGDPPPPPDEELRLYSRNDCFSRGTDSAIHHRLWMAGEPDWFSLGGTMVGSPECVRIRGGFHCFARGTDNALQRNVGTIGSGWGGWRSLGGVLTSDPECVSSGGRFADRRYNARLDCFVRNTSNGLSYLRCDGDTCQPWVNLDGILASRLSCTSLFTRPERSTEDVVTRIDCVVRGTDNTMFHKALIGTTWGPWRRLNDTPVQGDPSCVTVSNVTAFCFARSSEGRLVYSRRVNTSWTRWFEAGTRLISGSPSCIYRPLVTRIHCVARDQEGRVAHVTMLTAAPITPTEETIGDLRIRE